MRGVMIAAPGGGGTELSEFAPEALAGSRLRGPPGTELSSWSRGAEPFYKHQ